MRYLGVLCAVLALGGCSLARKPAVSKFKGVKGDVATAFSTLASAAKSGDEGKICNQVLSTKLAATLGGPKHCKDSISDVLDDSDPGALNMDVQAVTLGPGRLPTTATAKVKSGTGKHTKVGTLMLVKQAGSWRLNTFG